MDRVYSILLFILARLFDVVMVCAIVLIWWVGGNMAMRQALSRKDGPKRSSAGFSGHGKGSPRVASCSEGEILEQDFKGSAVTSIDSDSSEGEARVVEHEGWASSTPYSSSTGPKATADASSTAGMQSKAGTSVGAAAASNGAKEISAVTNAHSMPIKDSAAGAGTAGPSPVVTICQEDQGPHRMSMPLRILLHTALLLPVSS
jgi:hypothetical protein